MSFESTKLRCCSLKTGDGIAVFEMLKPESRNAFNPDMKADHLELVARVRGDRSIRSVVIAGSGGAFCAGGDLKALTSNRDADGQPIRDVAASRVRLRDTHAWFEQLFNLEVPVIAAVDGAAFGAGFSLALAADFIVASPRASFCMAFNRIGAIPDLAALYMLPRMIGLRKAKDIMMTARVVGCEEAHALGIVHSVHPAEGLLDVAIGMAKNFAQGSVDALAFTKVYANQSLESDYATMARLEAHAQAMCLNSDYFFDAVERFVDRKPARFVWNG
ncbi:MAG TPA: enoyl-CoA hydratase/isomerase family protein [Burkholderiaceae bacterium]|nr:enoyl-CoA hydratase/isomerase family protein [Burkholderiaceae bacterium]